MRAVNTSFHDGELPATQSFISVEPPNLMATALKKSELGDGLILRLYNSTAETVDGSIKAHVPVKAACLTNLNEQPLSNGELDVGTDGTISLKVKGHEIRTIRLGL
jgi:alpha-mannosidase